MLYDAIVSRAPILAGWSPDRKYRAETADGRVFFLRVAAPDRAERLERVFRLQSLAAEGQPAIARPLECGPCAEGFYVLEAWIEGENARAAIPKRSDAQLYADGLAAGRLLRNIHSIPAPAGLPDWGERFNAKIDRRIAEYLACPLKYEGDEALLAGAAEHRALLAGRPQCFQHGDFHVENFIYQNDQLAVIDFDRCGFGDPWEDFDSLVWTAAAAPALARGQVDGYFDGGVPEEFWRLMLLYLCSGVLGSLPWAIPYGEAEVRVMREQAKRVAGWYADGVVPAWYALR
ncbi:MAG: phosphotransferase [Oscillospiraceae bacterium]|nr:phosphotransferase [Oscillospiraceae bacterium]